MCVCLCTIACSLTSITPHLALTISSSCPLFISNHSKSLQQSHRLARSSYPTIPNPCSSFSSISMLASCTYGQSVIDNRCTIFECGLSPIDAFLSSDRCILSLYHLIELDATFFSEAQGFSRRAATSVCKPSYRPCSVQTRRSSTASQSRKSTAAFCPSSTT